MPLDAIGAAMQAMQDSELGRIARSSSWLYPLANLIHVLGAALLVGAIAAFDVRVLLRGHGIALVAVLADGRRGRHEKQPSTRPGYA